MAAHRKKVERKEQPQDIRMHVVPPGVPEAPAEYVLDDLDMKIMEIIQQNARMSNVEIAASIGTSEATVRRRIQALVDNGVIRGFFARIDHKKFRPKVRIQVAIEAELDSIDAVSDKLMQMPGLCSLYRSIGAYNLMCELLVGDMSEAQRSIDDLSRMEGVNKLESMITTAPLKPCPWYGI